MQLYLALAAILAVSCSSHEIEKRQAKYTKDGGEKRVVCYYTNWSVYRKGLAKFTPQNINPYLCTHLVYAFGGLTDEFEVNAFDSYQDIEQGGYAQFNGLKQYNKEMKTLLALGGWNEGSARFSELVSLKDYRKNFTISAIRHLRRYNFDGLDLDWEYPGSRDGSTPEDKENYAILVKELREAFELEASKSSKQRLLLTMAVPAGQTYIDRGYDIPMLDRYLDFFNMLTYDYHSVYEPTVNHHAALYPPPGISEYEVNYQLNVDWTVRYYLKKGASKEKLVIGIPTYGRSYTLLDGDFFTLGSSANGPGAKGNYTNEKGYLSFYEVCEAVAVDAWEVRMPYPKRVGPFAFKADQWVGYDDESIVEKKSEYVRDNGLGGIMFWTIDSDDFRGLCNGRQYPLIEAAKEALYKESPTAENEARALVTGGSTRINEISSRRKATKTVTTTTESSKRRRPGRRRPGSQSAATIDPLNTPEPPTTPSSVKGFNCKREGFYPNPDDCRKYYWCLDSGASGLGIVAHGFTCPSDLIFNKKIDGCDHPDRVKCKLGNPNRGGAKATPTSTPIPRTTEFEHLLEDYEYYYDLNLDNDPVKPLPELTLIDEEPLEANIITPTRNSGGSQFQLPRETTLEQPITERAEVTTKAPRRNLGGARTRPQYSSIQRERTRVAEEPSIQEETEVVRQDPIAAVEEKPSLGRQDRVPSRRRRPQYVTLNRQHPAPETSQAVEPREEFVHEEVETTTQAGGGLSYVTLNRRRRPSTEPSILVEDKVTNPGLEYVTLHRDRPKATTEITPDYEYDYADVVPEAKTTTTSTTTTTTTTTTTNPPKIRIPPSFRNQNTRARARPSRPRPDGSTRRRLFRGRGRTTPEPEPHVEEPVITESPLEIAPVTTPVEPILARTESPVDTVAPVESVDEKIESVVDPVELFSDIIEPTVEKVQSEVDILKPTLKPEKTPLDSLIPFIKEEPSSKPEITAFESLIPEVTTTEEPFEQQVETEVPETRSEVGGQLLDETFLLFHQNNQESQTDMPEEDSTGIPFFSSGTETPSSRKIETTGLIEQPEAAAIPVESPDPAVRTPLRTRNPDRKRLPPRDRTPPRSRDRILPPRRPSLRLRPGLQPTAVRIDGELEVKEHVVNEEVTAAPTESSLRHTLRRRPSLRPSIVTEESKVKIKEPKILDVTDVSLTEGKPREPHQIRPLRPRPVPRPTEDPLEERQSGNLFEVSEDSLKKDSSAPTSPPFSFIDIFSDDREIIQKSDINNRRESKLKLTPIESVPNEESTTKITFPLQPLNIPDEEQPTSSSKPSSIFDLFDTTTERSFTRINLPEDTTPRRRVTKTTTTPEPLTEAPTEKVIYTKPRSRLTPRPVQQSPTERPSTRPKPRPRPQPATTSPPSRPLSQRPSRPRPVPTEKLSSQTPVEYDYVFDYYDGALGGALGNLATLSSKARLHADGSIECRDTGYFPHPHSCKKFISCSKTVRGFLRGWIYTCPQELVFDPVGGMCNWTETVDCLA